jgi:hypothetical protein
MRDRGFGMERDPFDKNTYESPIFDDARSDNLRLFGIVEGSILDRLVGRVRAAPYQFIAAGVSVLAAGAVCLALVLLGFFAHDLSVGIVLSAFFLVLGASAIVSALARMRKGTRIR